MTLNDARYFSLATFRKNGKEVATPVWFAAANDTFYVFSAGNAGKVKRIRAGSKADRGAGSRTGPRTGSRTGSRMDSGSRARVAPCDGRGKVLGEWQNAVARLVVDPAEVRVAYEALHKKYGLLMAVTDFFAKLNGRYGRRQLIAVSLSAAQ